MARLGRNGFLLTAVLFHLVYCYSIFDIYFVSPIVSGMREYKVPDEPAPAKRLVLFVGDGLRADKAFQSFPDPSPANVNDSDAHIPRPLMPFLRTKIVQHGTFGVSHTRVPTESRPGHVALIAGLYEDVSAVTTGWKHNPVNFDSVFNRSTHTWSWGSPDILPMFQDGAVPGRMDADTYGAEFEDFTGDAVKLDIWVFDKVKAMFKDAKTNAPLDAALRKEGVVFFLHLLGLDTSGHAYRPYSKEYLHNIKVVDDGVREIVGIMEEFYQEDQETAYVFTADHGMSDWGSHGDGHPDNTRTPLIAWGAGVAKPNISTSGRATGHEDEFSYDWNLDSIQRNDVAQADVAALMSYLIGAPFPVNSVGELPLPYLAAPPRAQAKALLTNAREILEMYRVKEGQKQQSSIRYAPFPEFSTVEGSINTRVRNIETLIKKEQYDEAILETTSLIKVGLEGLRYLQTYNWVFLRALVTAGYLGWMTFGTITIIDTFVLKQSVKVHRSLATILFFLSAQVALFAYLFAQKSPITYYGYSIFPIFFWEEVFVRREALSDGKKVLFHTFTTFGTRVALLVQILAFMGLLQALVWSYSNRFIYTICYAIAIAWPAFYGTKFLRQNWIIAGTWAVASFSMSIFTILPVVKVENLTLIMTGGGLMALVGILYLAFEDAILGTETRKYSVSRTIVGIQIGLIFLAMAVTRSAVISLQAKQGLPLGTQLVGWLVVIVSLVVPALHTLDPVQHYLHRMLVIFLAFAPLFIILTISYEGLFYVVFCALMLTWVQLEHLIYKEVSQITPNIQETPKNNRTPAVKAGAKSSSPVTSTASSAPAKAYRPLTISDIRPSLFTLYLLQSAFFSTGNIASISSFSLDAVYRLIPVFDPFSQSALVIFKILVPFVILSANLGILNKRLGFAPGALFMGLIVFGDWLTINFFWMVRDEGSWLEIGETISRFCIVSALCVFAAGIEAGSSWLIGDVDESI